MYYNSRVNKKIDTGCSITTCLNKLEQLGVCLEKHHPYDPKNFYKKPSICAYINAKFNKTRTYYYIESTVEDFKLALGMAPIICGMYINGDLEETERLSLSGEREGHSIVIYGYENNYFIARNSWGDDWGINGDFHIPFEYVEELCVESWIIV